MKKSNSERRDVRILLISDAWGFGLLDTKPRPLFQTRYAAIRNKALLVPEYGAMYVAAFLKKMGWNIEVINLIADLFNDELMFAEPEGKEAHGEDDTLSPISDAGSADRIKSYLDDTIKAFKPRFILFPLSVYFVSLHTKIFMKNLKSKHPDTVFITGGVYATMHADEVLIEKCADYVVRGEGEQTTHKLLSALSKDRSPEEIDGISFIRNDIVVNNPSAGFEPDIDNFPSIYETSEAFRIGLRYRLLKSLIPIDDYIPGGGFLTSRGCPEKCTFCLDPAIWKNKVRYHSPEYTKSVVDYCFENFIGKEGSFYFGDATFTLNSKRLHALMSMIKEIPMAFHAQTRADALDARLLESMRDAGFGSIAIGAESLNDRVLENVVLKRVTSERIVETATAIRKAQIKPILTFIAGLPGETKSDMESSVKRLRELRLQDATFFPLVVFKGTSLYEEFLKRTDSKHREEFRLNPWSDEFCWASGDFSSTKELIEYTEWLNGEIRKPLKPLS